MPGNERECQGIKGVPGIMGVPGSNREYQGKKEVPKNKREY